MRPVLEFAESVRVAVRLAFAFSRAIDGVSERVKAALPLTVRFIIPAKSLILVEVIVKLFEAPCIRLSDAVEGWIVNPETVTIILTDRTLLLFVPVTFTSYTFGATSWDAKIVAEA